MSHESLNVDRTAETSPPPCLIVCESRGLWPVLLRQTLGGTEPVAGGGFAIREAGHLEEALGEAGQRPGSLLLVDVTRPRLSRLVEWLRDVRPLFARRCGVVCIVPPEAESLRWDFFELGVFDVVSSVTEHDRVARLARNHLARTPGRPETWPEEVVPPLPWSVRGRKNAVE